VSRLAQEVTGNDEVPFEGTTIKYAAPWPRISMLGEVAQRYGISGGESQQLDALEKLSADQWLARVDDRELRHKFTRQQTAGEKIAWAFEALVEPMLPRDKPCFVVDFPLEVSPLARKRDREPRLVDRFEAFAGGMEIANAFSELNDPRDQEARFRAQVEAAARGDEEAMPYDRDYIRALEHGMPPTAGEGIGVDRLAMLFTASPSIRDVVLFPLLKPEEGGR
jgi:lysyl-tRNA synthetase, class II